MSTSPTPLELNPTRIVETNFKGLLRANDVHSLQGALASAEYLAQNTAPDPSIDDLMGHTSNLLRQAELNDKFPLTQENNPFKRMGYGWIDRYMVARNQASALIAFAGYRVASSAEPVTQHETERHFYEATEVGGRVDRGIALNEISKYCRGLAQKDKPLTRNEVVAILAGREVVSCISLNPLNPARIATRKQLAQLATEAI